MKRLAWSAGADTQTPLASNMGVDFNKRRKTSAGGHNALHKNVERLLLERTTGTIDNIPLSS